PAACEDSETDEEREAKHQTTLCAARPAPGHEPRPAAVSAASTGEPARPGRSRQTSPCSLSQADAISSGCCASCVFATFIATSSPAVSFALTGSSTSPTSSAMSLETIGTTFDER